YFEIAAWPLHFTSLSLLVGMVGAGLAAVASRCAMGPFFGVIQARCTIVLLAVVPTYVVVCLSLEDNGKSKYFPVKFPPEQTPIVEILAAESSLYPDGDFRGITTTITGCEKSLTEGVGWPDIGARDGAYLNHSG